MPKWIRCPHKGCDFESQSQRGISQHARVHAREDRASEPAVARRTGAARQMRVLEQIAEFFPRGIQTRDPVQLSQDLAFVDEIRARA